jgi:hypothetical protein
MPEPARNLPKVFMSYSQDDSIFAENLAGRLRGDGVSVWFDRWQIHVGDSIVRKIQDGLSSSDFLVIILSPSSTESKWVGQELNAATIRNIESEGVFVLPVLIKDCRVPPFLADRKYADFTRDPSSGYRALLNAIDHHFGTRGCAPETFRDTRLSIVHVSSSLCKRAKLPLVKFTIANRSGATQIISHLEYDVVEYGPYESIPESRVLRSVAVWNVRLPYRKGSFEYHPLDPVLIADNDAAAITLCFYCEDDGKPISPNQTALYKLAVRFWSDQGLVAASNVFSL